MRLLLPFVLAIAVVNVAIPAAHADHLLQMRVAQAPPPDYQPAPAPPPGGYAPPPPGYQAAPPPPGYGYPPPGYGYARPPSKGTGLIIGGSIMVGLGAVWFLTAAAWRAVETTYWWDNGLGRTYFYTFIVLGALSELIGVPLLIAGIVKRSQYNQWAYQHPVADAVLKGIHVAAQPGGGGVGWGYAF